MKLELKMAKNSNLSMKQNILDGYWAAVTFSLRIMKELKKINI